MPPALNRFDPIPTAYDAKGSYNISSCRTHAEKHHKAIRFFADCKADNLPQPTLGKGAGIVTVGGGKYWDGIVAGIRLARKLGVQSPIEIWYRDGIEKVYPNDIAGLDVCLKPIDPKPYRVCGGWEAKYIALTETELDRVLFLDADAYAISPLVDSMLGRLTERMGFAYWNDLQHMQSSVKWAWAWPNGQGRAVHPIQGGQLFIDRKAYWRQLLLTHWICQHRDFFYPQNKKQGEWHIYGDQDALRVAMSATGASPVSLGNAGWSEKAFVCSLQTSSPIVVHRCQAKMFAPEAKYVTSLPHELKYHNEFARVVSARIPATVFDEHYKRGLWGGGSGNGSTKKEMLPFIGYVKRCMRDNGLSSIADVGCGDGRTAQELCGIEYVKQYTGYDISQSALNMARDSNPDKTFVQLDAISNLSGVEPADMLILRDVLHHWPNDTIAKFFADCKALNRWKHVILCHDKLQYADGQDTFLGGYRGLNADYSPMREVLNDGVLSWKKLGEYLHKVVIEIVYDGKGNIV